LDGARFAPRLPRTDFPRHCCSPLPVPRPGADLRRTSLERTGGHHRHAAGAARGRRQNPEGGRTVARLGTGERVFTMNLLEQLFPGLRAAPYREMSLRTHRYNCIAWAAGDDANWWWP